MPIARVYDHKTAESIRVPVKIWTDDIEVDALGQLFNLAALPFIHKHVAAMPDVHWGMGSTVGSVIATKHAIIPAAVGVDIGCGMIARKLNLTAKDLPDNLGEMRAAIERAVPHGRTNQGGEGDRGAWGDPSQAICTIWSELAGDERYVRLEETHPQIFKQRRGINSLRHLGTLGTGNHFIELCLDENQNVWLMLHSGSRGIGNRFGSYFIEKAKELMLQFHIDLPDKDLAYLPDGIPLFKDYWGALSWAQDFASQNRLIMMDNALRAVAQTLKREVTIQGDGAINCHHNYASWENHFGENVIVTRKGAVRARKGDLGIIPGSMGARSYIVRGLGNQESFHSCSHGAGRRMSRGEAKRRFSLADFQAQTQGVECRKDVDVIDEIPGAYKDIDQVMEDQKDLVEVVATLKQVLCVKG